MMIPSLSQMGSPPRKVTIVESSRVSPPPGSVPETSLRLTFFDLLWFKCCPMQRLYFYRFPHSLQRFTKTVVPALKSSLSLALGRFFPFAGKFISPPQPDWPSLHYSPGDSVSFSISESSAGDFDALFADRPRSALELHLFAPALQPAIICDNGARSAPVMAVQVTFFPGAGFVLGVTFHHVAADGKSFHHFMKFWASLCNPAGDFAGTVKSAPFYGRELMRSFDMLKTTDSMNKLWACASEPENVNFKQEDNLEGKVRATFVISQLRIDQLKKWVRDHEELKSTSFVVTCALVWACMVKSEGEFSDEEGECCSFGFVVDYRERLGFPVPSEYFGNCLAKVIASVEKRGLVGPNGFAKAAKAIGEKVEEAKAKILLRDGPEIGALIGRNHFVTVAGSPRLGIYETDFGWGRPARTEVVHTDVSGAISLCDRHDGQPGIEVSLVLHRTKMKHFKAIFEESLKLID